MPRVKPGAVHPSRDFLHSNLEGSASSLGNLSASCPKRCHASSDFGEGTAPSSSQKLFGQTPFLRHPTDPSYLESIRKALQAPSQKTSNADEVVGPEIFLQAAQAAEAQGQKALETEIRLAHFETALFNYQLAQDLSGTQRIFNFMKEAYLAVGDQVGLTQVDAELNFLAGNFEEALQGFQILENFFQVADEIPESEVKSFRTELNLKISMIHQALAGQEIENFDLAFGHLEKALERTPSPMLAGQVVQFLKQRGKDPGSLLKEIQVLEKKIRVFRQGEDCPGSHHHPRPVGSELVDFGDSQLFEMAPSWIQDPATIPPATLLETYEQELAALQRAYQLSRDRVAAVVRTGFGNALEGETFLAQELALAQVLVEMGDLPAAQQHYEDLLALLPPLEGPLQDPKPLTLQHAAVKQQLAGVLLQQALQYKLQGIEQPEKFSQALQLLDSAHESLEALGEGVDTKFQKIQNRFLKFEVLSAQAKTSEQHQAAQTLLEKILQTYPVESVASQSPAHALLGRVQLRLAQRYFAHPDRQFEAHRLVREIVSDFSEDSYLASQALFAQGMVYLGTGDKALLGLRTLRELQTRYPQSEADRAIRQSPIFASVRGEDGVIRQNLDESDLGEALKVFIDRLKDKTLSMMSGALVAMLVFPEPSTSLVALTALAVGTGDVLADHGNEILQVYQSGFSNVSFESTFQNLLLLGADLAMLGVAGGVGSLVRQGVETGLSRLALRISEFLGKTPFDSFVGRALLPVGRFIHQRLPGFVELDAIYMTYKGERALFLGEKFELDMVEALLMSAMIRSFSMAQQLGVGSKVATHTKFSQGKLSPVFQDGKFIGFSNTTGRFAGWATDAMIGGTGYYALLWGVDQIHSVPGGVPHYLNFIEHNLQTLGPLHLGNKWMQKSLRGTLKKWRDKSNEWLEQARENINRPFDGGFPLGGRKLAWVSASTAPSPGPGFRFRGKPLEGSTVMFRSPQTEGTQESKNGPKSERRVKSEVRTQQAELENGLRQSRKLERFFEQDFTWIEQLSIEQLRALHRLSQLPSKRAENFLVELLTTRHAKRNWQFLTKLEGDAALGLEALALHPNQKLVEKFLTRRWLMDREVGVGPGKRIPRGQLVLEAYHALKNVSGVEKILEEIVFGHHATGNIKNTNYLEKLIAWRGIVDEFIRAGYFQAQVGESVVAIGKTLGRIHYITVFGTYKQTLMEVDAQFQNDAIMEAKSIYHKHTVGKFKKKRMGDKFKNQVQKYGAAVKAGKVKKVIYAITAVNVSQHVIDYILEYIPNVEIYRYNDIADTQGELLAQQNKLVRLPTSNQPQNPMKEPVVDAAMGAL